MYGYIYLTTNKINGKIYIGQKKSDKFLGNKYLGSGKKLRSAIKSYGKSSFNVQLIDYADDPNSLNDKEIYWIDYYQSRNEDIGYNISFGGGVLDGFEVWNKGKTGLQKMSEETKKKMSESHIGQFRTDETKKKISNSLRGKKRTEEQNQKNRERNIGRKWIHKDGINKTVSYNQLQTYLDDGWLIGRLEIIKHIPWNKGLNKETDNRVKKYGISRTGHKHSEESNKKNRESHLGRKYINNGTINKAVFQNDLKNYLDDGWVLGMLKKKSHS